MNADEIYIIGTMALTFAVFVGIVVAIFVYSGRRRARVRARVAGEIAASWRAVVTKVEAAREHQWWQTNSHLSEPYQLLHVSYRREDGVEGRLTVARNERLNFDSSDWALKYNLPDFMYFQALLPDQPPSYADVEAWWQIGTQIEKRVGRFHPGLPSDGLDDDDSVDGEMYTSFALS